MNENRRLDGGSAYSGGRSRYFGFPSVFSSYFLSFVPGLRLGDDF
jgi:hypothetical protein